MAAQLLPLSIQEFDRLYGSAKPAYEYWFGRALRKPMPTHLHGYVQFLIAMLLDRAGWTTGTEIRLKVSPEAQPIPDVIAKRGISEGTYPTTAPELCIEILSPGDTLTRCFEKAMKYIAWGSVCVWVIDPEKRTAWMLSAGGSGEPVWVAPGGSLQILDTAIALDELFAMLDQRLKRVEESDLG